MLWRTPAVFFTSLARFPRVFDWHCASSSSGLRATLRPSAKASLDAFPSCWYQSGATEKSGWLVAFPRGDWVVTLVDRLSSWLVGRMGYRLVSGVGSTWMESREDSAWQDSGDDLARLVETGFPLLLQHALGTVGQVTQSHPHCFGGVLGAHLQLPVLINSIVQLLLPVWLFIWGVQDDVVSSWWPWFPSRSSVLIYMYIYIYVHSLYEFCYRSYIQRECHSVLAKLHPITFYRGVRGSWSECHFVFSLVYQLCLALW